MGRKTERKGSHEEVPSNAVRHHAVRVLPGPRRLRWQFVQLGSCFRQRKRLCQRLVGCCQQRKRQRLVGRCQQRKRKRLVGCG